MMRRPMRGGVVRGVARTAVVAGTASAVAGRVHHHQEQKYAQQEAEQQMLADYQSGTPPQQYAQPQQQYAPPPQQYAPPPQQYAPQQQYAPPQQAYEEPQAPDTAADSPTVQQLERLASLHASGVLSDEEFASAKQRVLAGG